MFIDDNLPSELSAIEMRLRRLSVLPASVDRDATLFGAGWAAAETHWQLRASRAKGPSIWPAATGVLAASVAVLALLLFSRESSPQVAKVRVPLAPPVTAKRPSEALAEPVAPVFPSRFAVWRGGESLLARRQLALHGIFSESPEAPDNEDFPVSEIKSARELLQEYLPDERRSS